MYRAIPKLTRLALKRAQRLVRRHPWSAKVNELESDLGYKFVSYYKKNDFDLLSQLCDEYGSDKGEIKTSGHPYTWPSTTNADIYSRLFSHCRYNVVRVFECGLGTNNASLASNMGVNGRPGASLRVWRDYFPKAVIVGGDIDRDVLFTEDRIKTYYLDQCDPQAISEFWQQVGLDNFDLMIDDGLHTFAAGSCLFSHSVSRLGENGIYVIEDVSLDDLLKYKRFFADPRFVVDFITPFQPGEWLDHYNLVVVRRS